MASSLFSRVQRLERLAAGQSVSVAQQGAAGDLWEPLPPRTPGGVSPQQLAYDSRADELFYGGAAGGGKSDLLLGLALTRHVKSIIFRREYPQLKGLVERSRELIGSHGRFNSTDKMWRLRDGRVLEFGALQYEKDKQKFQGHPHDLLAFDELPHVSQSQFRFLIAWNRTTIPGQRCRVAAAGNPPLRPEERWVIEEWAPWLDATFPDPAEPGELRWYAMLGDKLTWLRSGAPFDHDGEWILPRSRTFIPARVTDNQFLTGTGYVSTLQGLPEPLRSQLLYGDMGAGVADDPYQVLPTEWIRAAQGRWSPQGGEGLPLSCLGVDVARGGRDKTVLSRRRLVWFAALEKHPGKSTPDGPYVVSLIVAALGSDRAAVNVDVIGVGSSVYDNCRLFGLEARGVNFAERSTATDKSGRLRFANLRAECYWKFREALDPVTGDGLQLPPDPELLADLAAPHWSLSARGIVIESKEDLIERLGRSPDCADAVVLAHYEPARQEIGVYV